MVGVGTTSLPLITKAALLLAWFGSQPCGVVPLADHWPTETEPVAAVTTFSIFSSNGKSNLCFSPMMCDVVQK